MADPSRYGLVRLGAGGRVETFLEKPRPEEIDTNLINAGLYVLEPDVLALVPSGGAVSIEREVFPRLAAEGSVYGLALPGYWLDVGTPDSYLQAHRDVLERTFATEVGDVLGSDYTFVHPTATVHAAARLVPPVFVAEDAVLGAGVRAGSLAVIGAGARVGEGTVVENAVVGAGATLGEHTVVVGSILGEGAVLGEGCEVRNLAVVGPEAIVGRGNVLNFGLRVGAGQEIPTSRFASDERSVRLRAAPRGEALGLGADLGQAEAYVGKLLFVRAGQALSLQYHREKDESWLVPPRAAPRSSWARSTGRTRHRRDLGPATRSATRRAPFIASPPSRTRSSSRSRPLTSTTSCASTTATDERAPRTP